MKPKLKVLFLCTGNSARSILGEFLLKKLGCERFEVHSAGSLPKGIVHPLALRVLKELYQIDASGARSKSLEEFRNASFDFVVTVCDSAREACPVFPGQPIVAHWSSPDPAACEGTEQEQYDCFVKVAFQIYGRLELFRSVPVEDLDRLRLIQSVQEIASS
jgi:arsenate reductase (thioredoxin)